MTYDFLYDEDKNPVINEFCCQFIDRAVYACPGYWSEDLSWIEGSYWPQFMQLKALFSTRDLSQPIIMPEGAKDAFISISKLSALQPR